MKDIIKIAVRGYHIDSYGHVNNTRYLEFLEEARWAMKDRYLKYFDENYNQHGLVVANSNINYLAPAFLGDVLRIESDIKKIGNKSVLFHHQILNDETNTMIVDAESTFVFFNREKNISEHIPKELRKNFSILLNDND